MLSVLASFDKTVGVNNNVSMNRTILRSEKSVVPTEGVIRTLLRRYAGLTLNANVPRPGAFIPRPLNDKERVAMYKKPLDVRGRLSSTRMSPTNLRAAIAHLERAETLVDLVFSSRDTRGWMRARIARVLRKWRAVRCKDRIARCGSL